MTQIFEILTKIVAYNIRDFDQHFRHFEQNVRDFDQNDRHFDQLLLFPSKFR